MDKSIAIGVSQAEAMIGVSRKTIERHIRMRHIRAVRIGRRVLIPVSALEDFLATNQPSPQTRNSAPLTEVGAMHV